MDFIFISTIINLLWTLFGIIFLLYQFTSFLSYIYGFYKFCGKLVYGINIVKTKLINYFFPSVDYIDSDSNYSDSDSYYSTDFTPLHI